MNPNGTNTNTTQGGCPFCGSTAGHSGHCQTNFLNQNSNINIIGSTGMYPFQTSSSQPILIELICCVCGEKKEQGGLGYYDASKEPHLCDGCTKETMKALIALVVPKDSKKHCPTCRYHVDACVCPEKKKMDELIK